MLVLSLLGGIDPLEPVHDVDRAWLDAFVERVDPARLGEMVLIDVAMPIADTTERLVSIARAAKQHGADEETERVVLLLVSEDTFMVALGLRRYGDAWRVQRHGSRLFETPTFGYAVPMTGGEFDELTRRESDLAARDESTPEPVPASEPTFSTASVSDDISVKDLRGLVGSDGQALDLSDLEGEPFLVWFGYTHDPDVGPAWMGELFGVFEAMPKMTALFITVDPERDSPAFLDEWSQYLPENLIVATGTPGAIRQAADRFGVKYAKVEANSPDGYTILQTADVFLVDETGSVIGSFPFGTTAQTIVDTIEALTPTP
jgi:protein SCO1/2